MIRWAWRFTYTFSLCVLVVQYWNQIQMPTL